ncbi:MAG: carbonic anhydrase [Deferribacteres bacterium]|nr:carbonic anhydrase [Deferribacteres bacterium]
MVRKVCLFILSAAVLLMSFLPEAQATHGMWGYTGENGPEHWGKLSHDFAMCEKGKSQSPVDINKTYKAELQDIVFSYKATPLKVVNNGHTVQVNYLPGSSAIIDGEKYELLQFHFHAPSENTVEGKHYSMEMHLVHKNSKNELAVVGVFLKEGRANEVIQKIWDNISPVINEENTVDSISINAADLLPPEAEKGYYHFYGSLTTPPCSEGVNWSVLKTPIEVSGAQIRKFEAVIGGHNNRPTQPINKRFILESK